MSYERTRFAKNLIPNIKALHGMSHAEKIDPTSPFLGKLKAKEFLVLKHLRPPRAIQ